MPTPRQQAITHRGLFALRFSLALLLSAFAIEVHAATLIVDTTSDIVDAGDGELSLREALAAALPGDQVEFAPALSGGTITLSGTELRIEQDLTIIGPGADLLTIDANGQSRVLRVLPGVTTVLSGLTVTGGSSFSVGGIVSDGLMTLTGYRVTGNSSGNTVGAGLSSSGSLTLIQTEIANNVGEGIRVQSGPATIIESVVSGSTSSGLVSASGADPILIVRSSFVENSSSIAGGAINNSSGGVEITIINSTLSGNSASSIGGAIHAGSHRCASTIPPSRITPRAITAVASLRVDPVRTIS